MMMINIVIFLIILGFFNMLYSAVGSIHIEKTKIDVDEIRKRNPVIDCKMSISNGLLEYTKEAEHVLMNSALFDRIIACNQMDKMSQEIFDTSSAAAREISLTLAKSNRWWKKQLYKKYDGDKLKFCHSIVTDDMLETFKCFHELVCLLDDIALALIEKNIIKKETYIEKR